MRATLPAIGALLLSVALLVLGNGLQNTLLPLRAQLEDFSAFQVGLLGSSFFLGFAGGGYYAPRLVQRVGHIRTFTAMMATASAIVLIHPLVVLPELWSGLRVMSGACFAVLYVVIESWLNERATNATRGAVFAVYAMISFVTLGFAQLLLLLGSAAEFPLFLLSSIILSVAAVPVALTAAAAPSPIKPVRIEVGRLYRDSPVGVIGCFAVGVSQGAFWAMATVFAKGMGANIDAIAIFMSVVIFAGAVGHGPLGWISDRVDRRLVVVGASLAAAAAGSVLYFGAALDWTTLLVAAGVFGFFAFPLYALSVALTNDFVTPERFVEAAGGLALIWGAGAVAGPILASLAIEAAGASGLFLMTLTTHLLLAAFAIHRISRRAPPPADERGAFSDAVRTVQTVAAIDVTDGDAAQSATEDQTPTP